MKVLHIYPINRVGEEPSSFRKSQIKSLEKFVDDNYFFPMLNRKNILKIIDFALKLRKQIKKESIDVVHCHWGSILALTATCFSTKPVIISFCGSDLIGSYKSNKKKTFKGKISTYISIISSYLAKHIIVKSEELYNCLPSKCKEKASIIPNGVDSNLFFERNKNESRKQLNLPLNKKIILFVNRKGAWVKNPKRARLLGAKLEELNWGVFLEIVNVDQKLMPIYFSASDFLLITSIHEGSCNILKEALFCNLKIITTPTGDSALRLKGLTDCLISNSNREIIDFVLNSSENKFIVPKENLDPIDSKNIANKIYNLYKKVLNKK